MKNNGVGTVLPEGAKVVDKGGYQVVRSYSEVAREYEAIRQGVGVIDFSTNGKFKITGEDHVAFIDTLLSIDIAYMDVEKTAFSLMLNEQGQIVDVVTVYKQEQYMFIESSAAKRDEVSALLNDREQYAEGEVVIEDISELLSAIAFEGPYAWKLGQKMLDFDISSLPFQSFVEVTWQDEQIIFARTGITGEYGYKVWMPVSSSLNMWHSLLEQGESDFCIRPVGMEALTIAMLEVRQPNVEFETKDLTVFEACLEWMVSFDKEDFLGLDVLMACKEEAVEKRLIGFIANEDEVLTVGDTISIEDEQVGSIVQVVYSYTLGKKLGLASVASEFAVSGLEMAACNKGAGVRVAIETVSSPYITPQSWSVKII